MTEANSDSELVAPASLTGIASVLTGLISDMATAGATLVDNLGANYSVVTPQSTIAMRQMHRKRRRSV